MEWAIVPKSRRQNFYDIGCAALRKLTGKEDVPYICPVCLNGFALEKLTEEHVPPLSIGGKQLCLTCSPCNSGFGHQDLHKEQRSRSFMNADGAVSRAKFRVEGCKLNVDLIREMRGSESLIRIEVPAQINDPMVVEELISKQTIPAGSTFELEDCVTYEKELADAGYLKSAYLAVFVKFGYAYIVRPALNRVREQIWSPKTKVVDSFRVYRRDRSDCKNALVLFREPVSCLGVQFGDSVVCLPTITGGDEFYEQLQQIRSNAQDVSWKIDGTYAWPETLEMRLDFSGMFNLSN
jgi:hypothetical protein